MPELKFEQQMKKLEEIVDKLEKDDAQLEESIGLYEEGLKLAKALKGQLKTFQDKINELNDEQ
ncbi:MAG: exodeoxyribonuclease VII small subunit [Erysipelotrichaceae bacterium]|nr:exodeoxyribonuclease VII small subunit [Erysipelotrichaceae bacterium]